jgi:long-chain acyl-CoA synthetase
MSFKTIPEMLIKLTEKYGSRTAFLYKRDNKYQAITHLELREKVECFALGLMELGIHKDDRIAIVSENRIKWIISDLAIASIGAVSVPLFTTLAAKQEEYIFNDCEVTAIIVSNSFQLSKVMEIKNNLPSLRHIIVMNKQFDTNDFTVKSMDSVITRGSELKTPEERKEYIEERIFHVDEEDLLTIIYTSGTTGNPKGVMLTHKNLVSNIAGIRKVTHFDEDDIFLSYLPLCHSYERASGYYTAFSSGAVIALAESIDSVSANLLEIKPTFITTVPRLLEIVKKRLYSTIDKEGGVKKKIFYKSVEIGKKYYKAKLDGKVSILLQAEYKIADKLVFTKIRERFGGRMKKFVSGGAPLNIDVCEFFLAAGLIVLEGYGLTEASPVIAANTDNDIEPGTIGKPLYNVEVKIAEDGEILARGPNIMKGYWGDAIATDEAIDEDGWLYTGDVGVITERGNLRITDRKKSILVSSGGKNIAPQPIENLLCQSPYIEQCIIIGDRREYCAALISPDFNQLKLLADNFGLKYETLTELISNPKIIQIIKQDIDRLQKDLAKYERVRKFSILSESFSVESGELTPKMSIRRHIVERKFSDVIDQMYGVD